MPLAQDRQQQRIAERCSRPLSQAVHEDSPALARKSVQHTSSPQHVSISNSWAAGRTPCRSHIHPPGGSCVWHSKPLQPLATSTPCVPDFSAGEGEDCWPSDLPEPPMHSRSMRLSNGLSDSFKRDSFRRSGGGGDSSSNPMQ